MKNFYQDMRILSVEPAERQFYSHPVTCSLFSTQFKYRYTMSGKETIQSENIKENSIT